MGPATPGSWKTKSTAGRLGSREIDNRRSSGRFHSESRRSYSRLPAQRGTGAGVADDSISLPDAVEQLERRLIEEALRNSGGNKQKAAQVLGLSRQGLIKKLKRLSVNFDQ